MHIPGLTCTCLWHTEMLVWTVAKTIQLHRMLVYTVGETILLHHIKGVPQHRGQKQSQTIPLGYPQNCTPPSPQQLVRQPGDLGYQKSPPPPGCWVQALDKVSCTRDNWMLMPWEML